jgi:hypothetical protein
VDEMTLGNEDGLPLLRAPQSLVGASLTTLLTSSGTLWPCGWNRPVRNM